MTRVCGNRTDVIVNCEWIQANWKCLRGRIKKRWGRLVDDHLDVIDGLREQLTGRIQKAFVLQRRQAERRVERIGSDRNP